MTPVSVAVRFVALGLLSAGCASEAKRPPIPPVAYIPASPSELAMQSPLTPPPVGKTEVTSAEVRAPIYLITRGHGRSPDQLGRMFAPTQESMAACIPATSGVVNINVERIGTSTVFSLDPNVKLGEPARRCILETLSKLKDLRDDDPGDPTKRLGPEGYTTHIMISW